MGGEIELGLRSPIAPLGTAMALIGLIISCAGPVWTNYLMQHLPDGRWDYRMTFLGACATALGGMFLRWFAAGQIPPNGFPVLLTQI